MLFLESTLSAMPACVWAVMTFDWTLTGLADKGSFFKIWGSDLQAHPHALHQMTYWGTSAWH